MAEGTRHRETASDTDRTQLKRVIGPLLLFFFILGDMLGGGIYALVGEVGAEVGGAIWTAFLAAFVLASLTAFAYVELASKYPRAAGAALYVNRAFKQPFFTFVVAYAVMCSGITSAGALAIAFSGDYFKEFIALPIVVVSLGFIAVIAVINAIGISESVRMNAVFTCIEVFGLLLIVVIGLASVGAEQFDFSRNFRFSGDGSPLLLIIGGASLAFYALIGFEDSVNVAEEVRHPAKSYPIALLGGLLAAAVIYTLVTMTASAVVPTQQLADSDGPLLEVVKQGSLSVPTTLFSAIALFALFNGALINMIMASRLVYGMAEERIVPSVLGRVSPRRQTPFPAIVFTTILAAALVLTGDLDALANTTVVLLLAVFAIVNVAVLVLRSDHVDHDHYVAPTLIPVLGALVSLGMLTQHTAGIYLRAGILLAVGVALWFVNRALGGGTPGELDAGTLAD
ncbi:MAG TPA: amino acid permease [Euzebyales bacterium]